MHDTTYHVRAMSDGTILDDYVATNIYRARSAMIDFIRHYEMPSEGGRDVTVDIVDREDGMVVASETLIGL